MEQKESNRTLKIASYNVHGWADANFVENSDRVAQILKEKDVDVVGLQESNGGGCFRVQLKVPQFQYIEESLIGTSIMSRTPISSPSDLMSTKKFGGMRYNTVQFMFGDKNPIYLTNVHFDYRNEELRLREFSFLESKLKKLLNDKDTLQIWMGDFNALTREDYTEEEWAEVAAVRAKNKWEAPQVDFMNKVRALGLIDIWNKFGKPRPLSTCRFNTRIDYIFVTPSLLDKFDLIDFETVDSDASDHKMLLVTFQLK